MMIRITKDGATLTLTRGEQVFTLPAAEAPQLIAAVLDLLGVSGTAYQRGYQLGVQDGLIEGYARRDREYIVARLKAQRERAVELRRALLAQASDARTA
jgi:hypothetical protein